MNSDIAGVLLAGGRSRRFGSADKSASLLGGTTLLERAIARARPQVATLYLNVNEQQPPFAHCGLPVIADTIPGFAGPLAGILAAMERITADAGHGAWLASFPVDTPWFPTDLVSRLREALGRNTNALVAVAASKHRLHPVFALWATGLAPALREALERGDSKVESFIRRFDFATVQWPDVSVDPFFNINTPDDLRQAELRLATMGDA